MNDRPAPYGNILPPVMSHIHRLDWWVAHKVLYPLFRWVITYTAFEQWHIVRILLITIPFLVFVLNAKYPYLGLLWLLSFWRENYIYFVKLPKEQKTQNIKTSTAVDSRHSLPPNYLLTGLFFFILMSDLSFVYTHIVDAVAPDLIDGFPDSLNPTTGVSFFPWALYHITQWLDFPPKKSLKEELGKRLLLKKQRETVRVLA